MFGIRRITINSNAGVGDRGVQYLADAFKSDLWLKALDMQDCGVTTVGANYLLDGLKFNAMMHVLDVRRNPHIDRDTLQKIMEQVMINSSGNSTDYEWMPLNPSTSLDDQQHHYQQQQQQLQRPRQRSGQMNNSFSKKIPANTSIEKLKRMKRCKSTGSVVFAKSSPSGNNDTAVRIFLSNFLFFKTICYIS